MMKRLLVLLTLIVLAAGCTQPAQKTTTSSIAPLSPATVTTTPAQSDNLDSAFTDLNSLGALENETGS